MNETQGETVLDARLTHFIAIGDNHGWGKAETEQGAMANMRKAGGPYKRFFLYRATTGTYVNDMGGFSRPGADPEPVKIKEHNPKK
jgi:hypothetical protein